MKQREVPSREQNHDQRQRGIQICSQRTSDMDACEYRNGRR